MSTPEMPCAPSDALTLAESDALTLAEFIDNVIYTRCPELATPSEWRIVIAQRGWVFVGRWTQAGDNVTLTDAKVIRTWGTTKGLGELALNGPTSKTVLDPTGTVRLHQLGVVATIDTKVTTW